MVDRTYLDKGERETMHDVVARGLGLKKIEQWLAARIALARSLQMPDAPDSQQFKKLSQSADGSTIHSDQLTGEGGTLREDFTDVYRALLSVYSGRDLFATDADEIFNDQLQAHVRRGLKDIADQWQDDRPFSDYLLRELFFDQVGTAATAGSEHSDLQERITRILGQIGVEATVEEAVEGPRITRFTLLLAALDDFDRLRKGLSKIAFALGWGEHAVTTSLATGERRVYLSVPRPTGTWRAVDWKDVRGALRSEKASEFALPVCVGTDILGTSLLFDLADAPHLFIGGTTGSGKSMCLHAILLSLLSVDATPELLLIDPKAVEFSAYAQNRHVRGGKAIVAADEALKTLEGLVVEMGERQEKMQSLDARNLTEANARGANLSRLVVVIDELGDLFMTNREIETPLIRLAQKARSAGIHLVLATQRPEAATFPGLLRSNVPSRIALTVQKSAESRIILDETGAEALLMRGDMLVRLAGHSTQRAHGCRVTSKDIQEVVRS